MSSDQGTSSGLETWNTKWADFALVLETGEELKCHKMVLAKTSPFFEAMLSSDCMETKNNKMKVKDFSLETVSTCLEYFYADQEWVPEQDLYKKKFDKTKVCPELLRMCHMYELKSLQDECIMFLKKNIDSSNAVEIWIEAERCKNNELKELALKHIAKKKENISIVPGMDEAYKCPELVKSLVEFLACRRSTKERVTSSSSRTINVKVKCTNDPVSAGYTCKVQVKTTDTVKTLKEIIYEVGVSNIRPEYFTLSKRSGDVLVEDRTLASYDIDEGSSLKLNFMGFWG